MRCELLGFFYSLFRCKFGWFYCCKKYGLIDGRFVIGGVLVR